MADRLRDTLSNIRRYAGVHLLGLGEALNSNSPSPSGYCPDGERNDSTPTRSWYTKRQHNRSTRVGITSGGINPGMNPGHTVILLGVGLRRAERLSGVIHVSGRQPERRTLRFFRMCDDDLCTTSIQMCCLIVCVEIKRSLGESNLVKSVCSNTILWTLEEFTS